MDENKTNEPAPAETPAAPAEPTTPPAAAPSGAPVQPAVGGSHKSTWLWVVVGLVVVGVIYWLVF